MTTPSITRKMLTAVVIGVTAVSLTACSQTAPTAATSGQPAKTAATLDAATAALVSRPEAADHDQGKKKAGARIRLSRALHATWVTKNKQGTVTHQAIRGQVSAVSATSITVKAADGFSQTYSMGPDTKVLVRNLGAADQAGRKATASSVSALKVGARALVVGQGTSSPKAKRVLFLTGQRPAKAPKAPRTGKPLTPKTQKPTATNPSPTVAG